MTVEPKGLECRVACAAMAGMVKKQMVSGGEGEECSFEIVAGGFVEVKKDVEGRG